MRTDYDQIADRYDAAPYRTKEPDPALLAFAASRGNRPVRALDLGCGTGNQQLANRPALPNSFLVGADRFLRMLEVARGKTRDVPWVQCDGVALPFAPAAFDFVSDQYSLHHVRDKAALVREVFRVLAPGGRFVLQNISPENMRACALYRYFPPAEAIDRRDFLSDLAHEELLFAAGFVDVRADTRASWFRVPARKLLEHFRDKTSNSELNALSEQEWRAGLDRLSREIDAGLQWVRDGFALLEVRGDKPR